ncbi:MAG: hypothetical protein WAJ87_12585 [Bryobacteraceae bacterium]
MRKPTARFPQLAYPAAKTAGYEPAAAAAGGPCGTGAAARGCAAPQVGQ